LFYRRPCSRDISAETTGTICNVCVTPTVGTAGPMSDLVETAAQLGRGGAAWGGAALLARWLSDDEDAPSSVRVAVAVWGSFAVSVLLARVIDRDRPCHGNPEDDECPDGPSFPSDQAAAAFAGALIVARLVPAAQIPALGVAAVTSLARARRRFHYVSDVVAGAVLGTAAARLALRG
jgi:membrane-associated phospholipid phosphatase